VILVKINRLGKMLKLAVTIINFLIQGNDKIGKLNKMRRHLRVKSEPASTDWLWCRLVWKYRLERLDKMGIFSCLRKLTW